MPPLLKHYQFQKIRISTTRWREYSITSHRNGLKKPICAKYRTPFPTRRIHMLNTNIIGKNMATSSKDINIDPGSYACQLTEQLKRLDQIDQLPDGKRRDLIRDFMGSIGKLYLDHFQEHLPEAQKHGRLYQEKISKAVPFIQKEYVWDLEHFLQGIFEGYGEWERACQQRTIIEAFNAMFNGIVNPFDTEEIETCMQNRKYSEGIDQSKVPKNIPQSHWWWYN